jgi:ATP-dependent exoDNAse (exonuclease V) beta subunit
VTGAQVASSAEGVRLIGASAGSGKTFRLTHEVTRAVMPDAGDAIQLEGLVAVTYTKKAQAELEARIRRVLLGNGAFERARQLPLSYLGTVHAVGLRLLQEFAIDAGLSPEVDVIPGNEGRRLLQATLEQELPAPLRRRLQELALELQLNWDGRTSRTDWVTPVDDIMTLARGNRIDPDQLPGMGKRSVDALLSILPPRAPEAKPLEAELDRSIETAIGQLLALGDETKKTQDAVALLRAGLRDLRRGRLGWSDWARLSRLDPAKRALPLVLPVTEAALGYLIHPRLRAQLVELTGLIFEAASIGLRAYAEWKAERGLVDYVDMIDRALDVLGVPEVEDELRQRLQLLVVDEFQDTSPIQLALFTRLHAICGRSVWVGDRKQCIFEYAGADPSLMEAATDWVTVHGGQREYLENNRRSRPELVHFTSTLFSAAFAPHGHSERDVEATAVRPALPDLTALPPVGLWWLEGKEQLAALAEGVGRLLRDPAATPVLDRVTQQVRPVRPSDIAVLVYSNAEAERLSRALKDRGILSVLPRVGLLTTPEGTLVSAALRYLVDTRDTLASAELDALTGFGGSTAHEWLAARIRSHEEQRVRKAASSAEGTIPGPDPADASNEASETESAGNSWWKVRLGGLRHDLQVLSPAEALDRVLAVLDVSRLAVSWPDPEQRFGNIEALRALAAAYERRCAYQREAASLEGLLRYFEETQQVIRQRDEERATDEQHVGSGDDAVVISTFHKSKGLEWPVVIVASLGRERKRDAFDVTPETDQQAFDATAPLAGRWIRYWPWPLSPAQRGSGPLAERAEASAVGTAITGRDRRERVRLLYVAFTRARDHLVLAIPLRKTKGPSKAWLDELQDSAGLLLTLPDADAVDPILAIRGRTQRLALSPRTWRLTGNDEPDVAAPAAPKRYWFARPSDNPRHDLSAVPPYRISPSSAATDPLALPPARVLATTRFTRRMAFTNATGTSWDAIGTALHAFLAADLPDLTAEHRLEVAERILANAQLTAMFAPDVLLAAGDALRAHLETRWPGAKWHREIPVAAVLPTEHGARRIEGTIDLLLETPAGYVIIDHKSFPGRQEHWAERSLGYAPQLMTYARAIRMTGAEVLGMLVHFTVGGGIVEVGDA